MYTCSHLLCDLTAEVWGRGKPWCRPHYLARFGIVAPTMNHPLPGAAQGRASTPASVGAAEPAPLTTDELLDILENDGWNAVEFDLFLRDGRTLRDLEIGLEGIL